MDCGFGFRSLKQGGADHAEEMPQRLRRLRGLMLQCHQQIADECSQNLDSDRVFRTAEEVLNLQVLLDPFEEKLDPPALFVTLGDLQGGTGEIVRRKYDRCVLVGPSNGNSAQLLTEVFVDTLAARISAFELDDLVSENNTGSVFRNL